MTLRSNESSYQRPDRNQMALSLSFFYDLFTLQVFAANYNNVDDVDVLFPQMILARYLRFEPLTRKGDNSSYQLFALRLEVIGCAAVNMTKDDLPATTQGTVLLSFPPFI